MTEDEEFEALEQRLKSQQALDKMAENARELGLDYGTVDEFKERLAHAIEQMPFGDTASSFAQFVRDFK